MRTPELATVATHWGLYGQVREQAQRAGHVLPDFETFWQGGPIVLPAQEQAPPLLAAFAADPAAHPLLTPSGLIELYSDRIASFGYDDCPLHPAWLEPSEWLGAQAAQKHPLHLVSNAPVVAFLRGMWCVFTTRAARA